MDEPGNRGFSGAAEAARGQAVPSVKALILMGDWCATATPTFENQVCAGTRDRQTVREKCGENRRVAVFPIDGDG